MENPSNADHFDQILSQLDESIKKRNNELHWELVKDYGLSANAKVYSKVARLSGRDETEFTEIVIKEKDFTTVIPIINGQAVIDDVKKTDLFDEVSVRQNHIDAVVAYFGRANHN